MGQHGGVRKGPPPDNGLEVMYKAATLGERMLGHGDPSGSARGNGCCFGCSMPARLWVSRWRWPAIGSRHRARRQSGADPGNGRRAELDVAERADVIVEMNNPGVWAFGSTEDDDRNMGMGLVVEYENRPASRDGCRRKPDGTTRCSA